MATANPYLGGARAVIGQGLGMGWGDEAEAWLRSKLANSKGYEAELKTYDEEIDGLVARQQTEMQDKRAYGFGPVAKKMQMDIDTKRAEKDKFIKLKAAEVGSWRKQLDFADGQINQMSDDLRQAYKDNETRSHGYDGLLKRIQISHEIGGIIPWIILGVFLCIEMGPIFFKMMLNKGKELNDTPLGGYNH